MRQEAPRAADERHFVRRIAPSDELDEDLGPPPPRPHNRSSGTAGRRRRARAGGRHCRPCHAAAVRRWRENHARDLAIRRRDAAGLRDDDAKARDSARAKVAMALRRGSLKRGHCGFCGGATVIATIPDPARWREIVWVCRDHRQAELGRRQELAEQRAAELRQAQWYAERDRVLAAIDLLPPEERAQLHTLAGKGPAGVRLSPGAPLYTINLVRVFKSRLRPARGAVDVADISSNALSE